MLQNSLVAGVVLAGVTTLTLFASPASAETIALQPSADTTLFEVEPDNALGGAVFFNGGTTANGKRNRGLLFFNLTGMIPPRAQINSVLLSLDVVRQPAAGPESSLFSLRRVLASWGEGSTVEADPSNPS